MSIIVDGLLFILNIENKKRGVKVNLTFNEAWAEDCERLEQFVPIVERVHGEKHPEFFQVKELFDQIREKTKRNQTEKPPLSNEFSKLREVTDNYTVPADVCESYEAVYNMLHKIDEAYQS